ncbi:secretion protein [Burkholderia alba]|uniref:secretion protein n=1 Tax=Burkholderia alba TaxID=2683677 RepID=UPI002B062148|nr:secretion protein [Burkholderia alba]
MTRRPAALAALALLALAGPAVAVPLVWPLARFDYAVRDASAADALRALARRSGIAIEADEGAACRLGVQDAAPPQRFVDSVAAACGLVGYYDGAVLQLVPPDAFRHAAARLNYATLSDLRATLARQKIVDPRWRPDYDDAARIVRVTGPSRYVALVLAAVRALDRAAQARVPAETRAFKLRARTAADRVVAGATGDAMLPGVVTTLRQRLEQDGVVSHAAPDVLEYTTALPVVDADARSNTVLIRDLPERLARDARLVGQLDTLPAALRLDVFGATLQGAPFDAAGLRWRDAPGAAPGAAPLRVAIAASGCAPLRTRLEQLAAHGGAAIDLDRSTLTSPDGSADFERLQRSFVATRMGKGDTPTLEALRSGFAMRITPRETAQASRIALDMRMVERWASGDGGGAPETGSRDSAWTATLAAGECAVVALPPPAARMGPRIVLVASRMTAGAAPEPVRATAAAVRPVAAAGSIGLRIQTRLLAN